MDYKYSSKICYSNFSTTLDGNKDMGHLIFIKAFPHFDITLFYYHHKGLLTIARTTR